MVIMNGRISILQERLAPCYCKNVDLSTMVIVSAKFDSDVGAPSLVDPWREPEPVVVHATPFKAKAPLLRGPTWHGSNSEPRTAPSEQVAETMIMTYMLTETFRGCKRVPEPPARMIPYSNHEKTIIIMLYSTIKFFHLDFLFNL